MFPASATDTSVRGYTAMSESPLFASTSMQASRRIILPAKPEQQSGFAFRIACDFPEKAEPVANLPSLGVQTLAETAGDRDRASWLFERSGSE